MIVVVDMFPLFIQGYPSKTDDAPKTVNLFEKNPTRFGTQKQKLQFYNSPSLLVIFLS